MTKKKEVKPKKAIRTKKTTSPKKKSISKKIKRVSTGVPNFDKLVEGGFEKNSSNLLVGTSGAGKTIFGTQFLIEGIKNKEKCLYVSFEEKKTDFYKNMLSLGINLEQLEKQKQFFFLEYTPQKVKAMLEEGGGSIEATVLTEKISRVVIDSISSFLLLFEKELEKKESILSLMTLLKGWECTTLLISEEDPQERADSKMLDLEMDAIILLYLLKVKNQRARSIEILKMRGTNHSQKMYSIKIDKKGISVGESHSSKK